MKQPIKDLSELKLHTAATSNVQFEDVESSLQTAFEEYVLPVITEKQYHDVTIFENQKNTELLEYAKKATANLGFWLESSKSLVLRSQAGSHTQQNAPKLWQYQKDEEGYKKAGFLAIEQLLKFLERNQNHFLDWANSDYCSEYKSNFVKNVDTFQKYADIQNSRILFLKCKTNLDFAQKFLIKPILGEKLYNVVLSEYKNNALREKHQALMELIQPAVASWAFFKSIPNLLRDSENLEISLPKSDFKEMSLDLAEMLKEESHSQATFFLIKLQTFLNENVREYPQFEFSKYYIKDSHRPYFGGDGKFLVL